MSDDALAAAGLKKINAFVRSEQSANAKRLRKVREKAAIAGLEQLNVIAPTVAHEAIKGMAVELRAGHGLLSALERALSIEAQKSDPLTVVRIAPAHVFESEQRTFQKLRGLRGWRKFLAKLLHLL